MQNIDKDKTYWPDNSMYFLTGSTFLHYPYFKTSEQKQIIFDQINKIKEKLNIEITAYSVAVNHYHLKFYLEEGLNLAKVKQFMHGGTSFEYKRKYKMKYNALWQSRKTFVITSDEMDWMITGYIAGNLLKHKEVSTFDELKNNPFSSYNFIAEKYGDESAQELVRKVIDIKEDIEGGVDMSGLEKMNIFRSKI